MLNRTAVRLIGTVTISLRLARNGSASDNQPDRLDQSRVDPRHEVQPEQYRAPTTLGVFSLRSETPLRPLNGFADASVEWIRTLGAVRVHRDDSDSEAAVFETKTDAEQGRGGEMVVSERAKPTVMP